MQREATTLPSPETFLTRISDLQREVGAVKNQSESRRVDIERLKLENESQAQQINRQTNSLALMRQQITLLESLRSQNTAVKEVRADCLCQFPMWALAAEQWSSGLVRMRHPGLVKLVQWARLQGDAVMWSQVIELKDRLDQEKE